MTDSCRHLLNDGETRCGRSPISADYYLFNPITGSTWAASLCKRHDSGHAKAYALAHGYAREERDVPALVAVQ